MEHGADRRASRMPLILVAEDDHLCRGAVTAALARAGFDLAVAHNGHEALDVLRTRSVDLVVLDLAMPDLGGAAVLEAMRRRLGWRGIPVIVMTALGEQEAQRRGAEPNVRAALVKSRFSLKELVGLVRAHLAPAAGPAVAAEPA